MKTTVKSLLTQNPDYLALVSASFLSGVGTTLSGIAIYHELGTHQASSFVYSLAFALTLLPGLISSQFSDRIFKFVRPIRLMIGLEAFGMCVIALAMYGARIGSMPLLLLALPLGSLTYGFLVPFLNTFSRSRFNDEDFLALAEISNLLLVLDFVLGTLIGTLIVSSAGVYSFFIFDLVTYGIAAIMIYLIYRRYPEPFQSAQMILDEKVDFSWSKLSSKQRNAFLMYPTLVAACSPCTAILPGAAENYPDPVTLGGLTLATPLLLMMAKTKGQFLGPILVRRMRLDELPSVTPIMFMCLLSFLACYGFVFKSGSLFNAMSLVILAHLFSNIVFTLSFVEFKSNFSSREIGGAATIQYQLGLIIMIGSSVGVGFLSQYFGNVSAVVFGLIALGVLSVVGIRSVRGK